jgi:hypothetical protein
MEAGPELEWLTRRLLECPAEFLPPGKNSKFSPDLEAVVGDLLRDLGLSRVTSADTGVFVDDARFASTCRPLLLISCWLLHDEWFLREQRFALPVHAFLKEGLLELSKLVRAEQFVRDPDRREEIVRLALKALGLVPSGETENVALDRLTTLSSVERKRVLDATKAARDHAERVRKAMAEKAAEESAARYGRE